MWESGSLTFLKYFLCLKLIGGILSAGLLVQNYWPAPVKRHFPLYWHITLMYTLPFLLTLYGLASGFSSFSIINITLGLFLLALLTTWQVYMILFVGGTALALGCYAFLGTSNGDFSPEPRHLLSLTFSVSFATVMGLLFSRKKQDMDNQRLLNLKSLAAEVAHELKTPLQSLSIDATAVDPLVEDDPILLKCALTRLSKRIQDLTYRTNLVLSTLRDNRNVTLNIHFMKTVISTIVESYPYTNVNPRKAVALTLNLPSMTTCRVDEALLEHVLHNLIKNAFEAMSHHPTQQLNIEGQVVKHRLLLSLEDNGAGIPGHMIEKIFQPFVTTKSGGTGVGLPFCRKALTMMGGEIQCISQIDVGTRLIITLPIVHNGAK